MTELLRPFLLARATLVVVSTLAAAIACTVAFRTRSIHGLPPGDARRIVGERELELGAAALGLALVAEVLAALIGVVGAASVHGEIRGAMCAYGVLTSTPSGLTSLATSITTALFCAAGLGLVRLDASVDDLRLTRTRAHATFALAPAIAIDAWTTMRFLRELDFGVVATCCSSGAEAASVASDPTGGREGAFALALMIASLASIFVARERTRALGGAFALALLPIAFVAAAQVTAPHVFGMASHRCAYCLLEAPGHHLGYALFAAAFGTSAIGAALLAVVASRTAAPDAARALEPRMARTLSGFAFATFVALLAPVLVHRLVTGAFVVAP